MANEITIQDSSLISLMDEIANAYSDGLLDSRVLASLDDFCKAKDFEEKRTKATITIKRLLPKAFGRIAPKGNKERLRTQMGEYLDNFEEYERLLYSRGGLYRDHLAHTLRVFCLGEIILFHSGLASFLKERGWWPSYVAGNLEAAWCLCTLWHDLGYPVQTVEHVFRPIRDMLRSMPGMVISTPKVEIDSLGDQILFQRFLEQIAKSDMYSLYASLEECVRVAENLPPEGEPIQSERSPMYLVSQLPESERSFHHKRGELQALEATVLWPVFEQLIEGIKEYNHGVLSSLLFLHSCRDELTPRFERMAHFMNIINSALPPRRAPDILPHLGPRIMPFYRKIIGARTIGEYLARSSEVLKADILFEIAYAMAVHDPDIQGLQINCRTRPLAFLLRLCDTLQEWGRPIGTRLFAPAEPTLDTIKLDAKREGEAFVLRVEFDYQRSSLRGKSEADVYDDVYQGLNKLVDPAINFVVLIRPRRKPDPFEVRNCSRCGLTYGSHRKHGKKFVAAEKHKCPSVA